ncbi:MAG: amino acid adenylation domain-containing protein [Bacteroidota bacterium]|nr:amino acid adenylation domain-containing protein [Bacteroidota bacterium]
MYVHYLFNESCRQFAHHTAVEAGPFSLTYAELSEKAGRLAEIIRTQAPEAEFIGISADRSLDMVVRVLAVLQAGKAYVPLDPAYPEKRLRQIISSAKLGWCLAPGGEQALFESLGLRVLPAPNASLPTPLPEFQQEDSAPAGRLAYVLFTSGSTGEPKGVCMGHAALVNLLQWQQANSTAGPGTRTLQFAPLSFDVSFQEIFATLTTGGTLVLPPEAQRRDLEFLLDFIEQKAINRVFLPFVALQHLAEVAVGRRQFPAGLSEIMTAGEQLKITPQLAAFCAGLPSCTLYNQYGPTESHVVTQLKLTGAPASWARLPAIGCAIANTTVHLLTAERQSVAPGETGELCISGVCLAEGYLNQPERTAEKFVQWNPAAGPAVRLYCSGDLARELPDGNLEFLGRQDEQVKIRGHRIELGEVEAILAELPEISQVAVVTRELQEGLRELVAYVVPAGTAGTPPPDAAVLRRAAALVLADYMLPAFFVLLPAFPKTSSGKIDRLALPVPATRRRAELGTPYQAPRTELERQLAGVWAPLLRLDEVGTTDNFFELGGNSLLAQKAVAQLQAGFGYQLPVMKLYQFPTVAQVASHLEQQAAPTALPAAPAEIAVAVSAAEYPAGDVAIIGMAGRFPGAQTVDELWEVLREGRETTRFFGPEELDASIAPALRQDPLYVRARGVLEGADAFDPAFFKLNPKLAAAMDPQQRIFLEIAWEALEQSGYLPAHYDGRVGVFAGCGNNSYYPHNVQGNAAVIGQLGEFQVMTANEKDYIATRVAYELDLHGPAVSVQSACSTSLLAIAQAVQSLRAGQCDVALAGGASITAPLHSGYLHQEGAMLSPDGHCRPFDAQAQGTVFSDGAGVLLLKQLAAARRDGDYVYAVIKGVGVANDGGGKGSFSAPSAAGQAAAIRAALADGAVAPATISYVEAHGTATPLGDPIEVEGLRLAFGPDVPVGSCALGSIKSNMGHLTAAAGVAGLIKTTLALQHRQLPPSLHYTRPNPHLDLATSPFFVNDTLREWPATDGAPRRAGISSFGVGGTNVHVVLEEAQEQLNAPIATRPATSMGRSVQLVTWSARTATSCAAYAQELAVFLERPLPVALADVAFTLQTTQGRFAERRFVVAATTEELKAALRASDPAALAAHAVAQIPGSLAFIFPGQGSQYLNMGRELYAHEPVFRATVDECAELLHAHLGEDIRAIIYPKSTAVESALAADRLQNTRYAQPALFVTEYALARLWQSWGVEPTHLCGHSIGEFVAACLAGVFTLPDALRLVAVRGRLISELPAGRMLSVRADAALIKSLLPAGLDLAAVNSRRTVVVAGLAEAVAAFAELLSEQNIPNQLLATSHAFHSAMMEPAVAQFEKVVAQTPLAAPQLPIISSVTGAILTAPQATDPAYWAAQLRAPVQFAAALDTLLAETNPLLLEVGPGGVTTALAQQHRAGRPLTALASLPLPQNGRTDYQALLNTMGQLWLRGIEPDWRAFYAGQPRQKLRLPTYCFDRQQCWLDPVAASAAESGPGVATASLAALVHAASPLASSPALPMRQPLLLAKIAAILTDAADVEVPASDFNRSFLELGLDSLLLTQVALTLKKEFNVPITFRQLNETVATPAALASYLDEQLPAPTPALMPAPMLAPAGPAVAGGAASQPAPNSPGVDSAIGLIAAQLELLARQVALLQPGSAIAAPAAAPALPTATAALPAAAPAAAANLLEISPGEAAELAKPFGATARIERQASTSLSAGQQAFLAQLTGRYNQKTAASKAYAQQHRAHLADPRVVSGFSPLLKEVTYPLVVNKSAGSRLWDLDGNEYVDALNGFGSSLFGHQPDFIKTALHAQVESGYEVGPQHALAGEVSQLLCELTGHDRAGLCNTGSEAVLGAMRIARTVTGRSLIVAFSGAYHGINDEVIVRGTKRLKTVPAAPGIMPEAVQNMLILDYGTDESLRIIEERAAELAAVLVEPVQSRRPEFQPVAFLQQLRRITAAAGTALIFDEVITGFRAHVGGAQALFGVQADLATYGKVIGGGLSIGAIAGSRAFMDALDGGFWQFGDASVPEVGVTYFAGTFVRHPLALAAARAALQHLKTHSPALQNGLNDLTESLARQLNAEAARQQLPLKVVHFGSLWKIKFLAESPHHALLFILMREKGVHIWDNFPCFLTTAHSLADVEQLVAAFTASVAELVGAGFWGAVGPEAAPAKPAPSAVLNQPPVPGARLGRDVAGNPAWFSQDSVRPGHYLQLSLA